MPVDRIIFLGSGPSVSLPLLACFDAKCKCCVSARTNIKDKNNRFNTSILVQSKLTNVLFDCGKTFYAAARRTLVPLGVENIDGVVLSHGHADAVLGLDDLRHYTRFRSPCKDPLTVYCDEDTFSVVRSSFGYLVNTRTATGSGDVASLMFSPHMAPFVPFLIGDVEIVPMQVEHGLHPDGTPYMCNAFLIDRKIIFISDVSFVPETVYRFIAENFVNSPPELLILDCLFPNRDMQSHVGWPGAQQIIKRLCPKQTLLVGMDHSIEHVSFDAEIRDTARLSYDGLIVNFVSSGQEVDFSKSDQEVDFSFSTADKRTDGEVSE